MTTTHPAYGQITSIKASLSYEMYQLHYVEKLKVAHPRLIHANSFAVYDFIFA